MFKVNIYIETSIHGPAKRDGAYMYIVEYITDSGETVTRQGSGVKEDSTELELALTAVTRALSILTKPCEIRINTQCQTILNTLGSGWHIQWEKNGWNKANGKPVKHVELWQQYRNLSGRHLILIENTMHSYKSWMQSELKRL